MGDLMSGIREGRPEPIIVQAVALRKRMLTRIDFACNDPDNGGFAGRVVRIDYRGNELEADDWDTGYAFTVDATRNRVRIHRRWYQAQSYKPWYGNWCWDAYWFKPREAKRLLRSLKTSGRWSCTSGMVRFSEWFESSGSQRADATPKSHPTGDKEGR